MFANFLTTAPPQLLPTAFISFVNENQSDRFQVFQ